MPRPGHSLKRALAGLLVLLVILLPAASATAMSVASRAAPTILTLDHREGRASTAPHHHSGAPGDGCEHRDNLACCLSCGYLLGAVPSVQPATRPSASAPLHFLMFSGRSPDGLTSAPDLPPPRHVA